MIGVTITSTRNSCWIIMWEWHCGWQIAILKMTNSYSCGKRCMHCWVFSYYCEWCCILIIDWLYNSFPMRPDIHWHSNAESLGGYLVFGIHISLCMCIIWTNIYFMVRTYVCTYIPLSTTVLRQWQGIYMASINVPKISLQ